MARFNTFDIETDRLGGCFRCGVILNEEGFEVFTEADSFSEKLLSREGVYYAHNGGKYDTTFLLQYIIQRGLDCEIKFNGSRIMSLKYNDLEIRDSFMLLPSSLEKILKSFYGKGKKNTWNTTNLSKLIERCKEDCLALADCLSRMESKIIEYGGKSFDNCYSVAGMSFGVFCSMNNIKNIKSWDSSLDNMLRDSYFGGRVENYKLGYHSVEVFDFNSMYPFCMLGLMPVGSPKKQETIPKKFRSTDLLKVNLFVKEDEHIGPLPFRQNKKVIYPVGRIEGYYFWEELKLPFERGVFDSFEVLECFRFREDNIFGSFVTKFYQERLLAKAKGDTFIDFVCKILLNSLYGKFATLDEHSNYKLISKKTFDVMSEEDKEYFLTNIYTVEKNGNFLIAQETEIKRFFGSNIAISSYITAKARALLYKNMIENADRLVYVDTDSLHLEHSDTQTITTSKELGGLKLEAKGEGLYIGAKMYRIKCEKRIRSKHRCLRTKKRRLKTVFKTANKGFRKFRFIETQGRMTSGKDLFKGDEWKLKEVTKQANYFDIKRIIIGDKTKPIKL